jgi:phosphoribosylglycinamide formyltransferase-1
MIQVAIFASGNGSNAEQLVNYFKNNTVITVNSIYSNKKNAKVLERANNLKVPTFVFNREDFYESGKVLGQLKDRGIDYIILAGFLWLIPANIVASFRGRIINIHPALLPKYGGKGMYGNNVHEAVLRNNDKESGITIHLVDEKYDNGNIIYQASCPVNFDDTPESLAQRVHQLEYDYFPGVVEKYILENTN